MTDIDSKITEIAEALYQYGRSMERRGLTTAPLDEPVTVASSIAAIHTLIEEVIGPDEYAGPWADGLTCPDCGTPDERHTRNQLRAEQRSRLTNQGDNTNADS